MSFSTTLAKAQAADRGDTELVPVAGYLDGADAVVQSEFYVQVDEEIELVQLQRRNDREVVTGWMVVRGVFGTVVAAHDAAAPVTFVVPLVQLQQPGTGPTTIDMTPGDTPAAPPHGSYRLFLNGQSVLQQIDGGESVSSPFPQGADPGDIADPSSATAEDVANKVNDLMAAMRDAGFLASFG